MKTYSGSRDITKTAHVIVVVETGKHYPLPLRLDLFNHSPGGFEWGYGGSGPAQLALAILADALCAPDAKKGRDDWQDDDDDPRLRAVRLHQPFKWAFITPLTRDDWTITEQAVHDFVRDEERQHRA